jgi:hypothetical protein
MIDDQKPTKEPEIPGESKAGSLNQEEQHPKIYLSHDGLFKFTFDNKKVAESFVREK